MSYDVTIRVCEKCGATLGHSNKIVPGERGFYFTFFFPYTTADVDRPFTFCGSCYRIQNA